MFRIRQQQIAQLCQAAGQHFEQEMYTHVATYFPNHCAVNGEHGIQAVIRHGVTRALSHGLIRHREICLYITVMFMLWSNFDEDVSLPWAAQILADRDAAAHLRMDRLAARALQFSEQVAGDGNRHLIRLFRLRGKPLHEITVSSGANFEVSVLMLLRAVYPSKYAATDEASTRRLVAYGIEQSRRYGILDPGNASFLILMMFLLGSAFDRDPFFPWAKAVLSAPTTNTNDEVERTRRLHQAGLAYLERWLQQLSVS